MILDVRNGQRTGRRERGVSENGRCPARSNKCSEIVGLDSIHESRVGVGSLAGVSRTSMSAWFDSPPSFLGRQRRTQCDV